MTCQKTVEVAILLSFHTSSGALSNMAKLPLIVGFGGISSAGRSSLHHGYGRLVLDKLSQQDALATKASLASVMGLIKKSSSSWQDNNDDEIELSNYLEEISPQLQNGSLIRQLEDNLFDPQHLLFHKHVSLSGKEEMPIEFMLSKKHLPDKFIENVRGVGYIINTSTSENALT